jgi:hypothetical protein
LSKVENQSFGLLIAYIVPGFIALSGLSPYSKAIKAWLGAGAAGPTAGGFLFATVGSVAAGLLASTVRWLVLDRVHAWMGLSAPELDFSRLQANIDAFQAVVEYHYRYYQAYGNAMVSLLVVAICRWPYPGVGIVRGLILEAALLSLCFFASRDALSKYYDRLAALYSPVPNSKGDPK